MQEANNFQGVIDAKEKMERSNKQVKHTAVKAVNTSFRAKDTSVKALNTNFRAKDTSVKAEDTSVKAKDTSVKAKDTSVKAKDTSVKAKDISVKAKDISVKAKDISVKAKDISVKAEDTSVKAENTKFEVENTSKKSVSENRAETDLGEERITVSQNKSQEKSTEVDIVVNARKEISDCLSKLKTSSPIDVSALQTVINTVKPVVEIQHRVQEQKNQLQEVKVDLPKPSSFRRGAM
jgi:ferric-dicitrate binding protein FerR (iron transport regulator)